MTSHLRFPAVSRQSRRAWLYVLQLTALGAAILALFILSEEAPFRTHWIISVAFCLACYLLASVLKAWVFDPLRGQSAAEPASLEPFTVGELVALENAPWLSLPVTWIPGASRWLSPRLSWSRSELVLTCRWSTRTIAKSDVRAVRAHPEHVELLLANGERLLLRTARIPSSVLESVYAPLAARLLSARASALAFNSALAAELGAVR